MLYLSAQLTAARSEILLGDRALANRRCERLARRYPQYEAYIMRTRDNELARVPVDRLDADADDPVVESTVEPSESSSLRSGRLAASPNRGVTSTSPQESRRTGTYLVFAITLLIVGLAMATLGLLYRRPS